MLADDGNPARYVQAAHSIRNITMLLTREIEREIVEAAPSSISEIIAAFEKFVCQIPFDDEKAKKENLSVGKDRLEKLLKQVAAGKSSMKLKLKALFGDKKDFERMTPQAQEAIKVVLKIWGDCHDYFNGISKDGENTDGNQFQDQWSRIQECWWSACCNFIDAAPEIDKVIIQGPPPNE